MASAARSFLLLIVFAIAMSGCEKLYDPQDAVEFAKWARRQPPTAKLAEIVRPNLKHSEPYFRHEAAEILLRMGDTSGVPVLVEMVNSPTALMDRGIDFRLLAPSTLADYDEVSAADSVAALYLRLRAENSPDAGVIRTFAAKLGARQIIPMILADAKNRERWPNEFEDLGILHATDGIDLMHAELENAKAPPYRREAVKVAVTWALARSGELEPHIQWLMEAARPWVENSKSASKDIKQPDWRAFECLTTLNSPPLRTFFEAALESQNPAVVKAALIYLRLHHPDSKPGKEKLLTLLQSNLPEVDWDTLDCLAWQSGDLQIEAISTAKPHASVSPFYTWARSSDSYRKRCLGDQSWKR